MFEVPVSDLQEDIEVSDDKISGTLKYLSGSNAITDVWGAGNFLALDFEATGEFSKIKVGLDPSEGSGLVELDEDMAGIFKITDKYTQKLVIEGYDEDNVKTFIAEYYLNELVCLSVPEFTTDAAFDPATIEFAADSADGDTGTSQATIGVSGLNDGDKVVWEIGSASGLAHKTTGELSVLNGTAFGTITFKRWTVIPPQYGVNVAFRIVDSTGETTYAENSNSVLYITQAAAQ